jgi:hypothetical protein
MGKTKAIRYSIFTNGIFMDKLEELFFSEWETNHFMTSAVNRGLIEMKDKKFLHGTWTLEKLAFFKADKPENKTVKTITVNEHGFILKINH